MKNIIKSMMLFAVAAIGFTACSNEEVNEAVKPIDTYTINFIAGAPESRTSVEVDGTTANFSWAEEGETFTFVQNTDEGLKKGSNVSFTNNGGLAEISATFTNATSPIVAVYPEDAWADSNNTNFNKAKLIVPKDQDILDGTFDPMADLLVSKVVTPENVTNTYMLQFTRLVAIGKMTLKNIPIIGSETIQKVNLSIDSEDALTGRLYIDLETAEVSEWGYSGQANNEVNLVNGSMIATKANDFYFTCMPATLSAGNTFTIEVTTDVAAYTHSVTIPDGKSIEFKSGRVGEFSVNMASAKRVVNVGISLPWNENFDDEDLSMYDKINGGSDTKVYPDDNLAGGSAKGEILIGKSGGSMTATLASDGKAKNLNLWFKSNKDFIEVSSATDGVTITKLSSNGYTVTLTEGISNFKITLTNNNSSNARVDDIVLTEEAPSVEKITIVDATISFTAGAEFVFDGRVNAIYENGVSEDVTEDATIDINNVDMNTAGTYTVTVTYNGISATYDVTILAADIETKTVELGNGTYANNIITWTQDDVTVVQAKGSGSTAVNQKYNTASTMRLYQGHTLTFSCDYNIIKIEMVTKSDNYGKTATVNVGTLNNPKTSGCTITWTGSAKQIVITNGSGSGSGGSQIQTSKISVTYEISGEPPVTPSFTVSPYEDQTIDADGGSIEFVVESINGAIVSATSSADWLTINDYIATATANNTGADRSATITFKADGCDDVVVNVSQATQTTEDEVTYLINEEFDNTTSADSSSAINTSKFPNFSGATSKAYTSKYGGIKLGSSSAVGYITSKTLDLSKAFVVQLDACKYGSDTGNIVVTVGSETKTISNSELKAAGTFTTYTLEFDADTTTSAVKIATSSKRAYIDNVKVYYKN